MGGSRIIERNKLQLLIAEFRIWWHGYIKLKTEVDCPYCGFRTHLYAKIYLAEQTGTNTISGPNCDYERVLTINEELEIIKEGEQTE